MRKLNGYFFVCIVFVLLAGCCGHENSFSEGLLTPKEAAVANSNPISKTGSHEYHLKPDPVPDSLRVWNCEIVGRALGTTSVHLIDIIIIFSNEKKELYCALLQTPNSTFGPAITIKKCYPEDEEYFAPKFGYRQKLLLSKLIGYVEEKLNEQNVSFNEIVVLSTESAVELGRDRNNNPIVTSGGFKIEFAPNGDVGKAYISKL
jgi:hypothetical protein